MRTLVSRGCTTLLPTQGGQFGHGQGGGLGRGFLRRTNEGPQNHDPGYQPPGRGCGVNALPLVVLAILVPLLGGLT
jgi:hypothetical protein